MFDILCIYVTYRCSVIFHSLYKSLHRRCVVSRMFFVVYIGNICVKNVLVGSKLIKIYPE